MKFKKHRLILRILLVAVIVIFVNLFINWYNGNIWLNNPSRRDYPVRGVDVSSFQGEINWSKLMEQSLDFAFIKATEGSLYVDETYLNNRQNIEEYRPEGIFGFYHFFSFESSGYNQADNFIKNVGDLSGYLPPVVDIELYGKLKYDKPDKETVVDNLSQMLTALENEYGVKPIIYTTYLTYSEYIEGNFNDYPLWIRNVFTKPKMEWTFWQFTDKGKLLGYKGEEKFIDMNVFYGSLEELNTMLLP